MTKKCSKCKIVKDCSEFSKDSSSKDKLQSWCKSCKKEHKKNWDKQNIEHIKNYSKNYYQKNREERLEYSRNYHYEHREERLEYQKNWRNANPNYKKIWLEKNPNYFKNYYWKHREEKLKYSKNYYCKHREEIKLYKRNYEKDRKQKDLEYKLIGNLRRRIHHAIKNDFKSGSAVKDLGCSIEDLKFWLEQQFKLGMTWDNYGEWHIDHIIPLSSVDLTDRKQLKKVCHWFNLQPLWAKDNLTKGAKI